MYGNLDAKLCAELKISEISNAIACGNLQAPTGLNVKPDRLQAVVFSFWFWIFVLDRT